jgi:hypothetical protein
MNNLTPLLTACPVRPIQQAGERVAIHTGSMESYNAMPPLPRYNLRRASGSSHGIGPRLRLVDKNLSLSKL